jgi:hypothetical protein
VDALSALSPILRASCWIRARWSGPANDSVRTDSSSLLEQLLRGNPLVVRGAVSTGWIRFPIPLSIRACGFPAHGLPMIFWTWLRSLRVADGAAKPVQAVPVKPLFGPVIGLSSM